MNPQNEQPNKPSRGGIHTRFGFKNKAAFWMVVVGLTMQLMAAIGILVQLILEIKNEP